MQGIEYASTWMKGNGMDHHRLDSNEASSLKNITPVLVPAGTVPYDELVLNSRNAPWIGTVSFIRW
jgi:hypothetical protein